MSAPLVPSPLDYIGKRRFAFYPAIDHGGPNEWVLGTSSWSEVQAINALTGIEIWVARQHIGAVSDASHMPTVGLRKALSFDGGELTPCIKRVIEIPHERETSPFRQRGGGPASVTAIRLEHPKKSAVNKAVFVLAATGLVLAVLVAWLNSPI